MSSQGFKETTAFKPKPKPIPMPAKEEGSGFSDTFLAVVSKDNILPNVIWKASDTFLTAKEEPWDPMSDENKAKFDSKWWPLISTKKTELAAFRAVYKSQQEERLNEIIENGSGAGKLLGSIYNGITSPFSAFPIATAIKSASYLKSFAHGFISTIPGIAIGAGLEEATLYGTQETRTPTESITNAAVSTITGGIIGGAGNLLSRAKFDIFKKLIKEQYVGNDIKFNVNKDGSIQGFDVIDDMVGKPSVKEHIPLINDSLVGVGKEGEITFAKPFFWLVAKGLRNPVVRGLMSQSKTTFNFINDSFEHNFRILSSEKFGLNHRTSLQSRINLHRGQAIKTNMSLVDDYHEYIGLNKDGGKIANTIKSSFVSKENKLNFDDYLRENSIAIVNGGKSDNPIIAKRAKEIIKNNYKPFEEKLIEYGLLPPDVKPMGAVQHMNRIYDKEWIAANRLQAKQLLASEFSKTTPNKTKEEILLDVDSAIDHMLGLSQEQLFQSFLNYKKSEINPIMKRVLDIEDEWLLKNKFLNGDTRKNIEAFQTRMGRFLELHEYFKEKGWNGEGKKLDWLINGIKEDYKKLDDVIYKRYDKKMEGKTDAEIEKLKIKRGKALLKNKSKLESDINLSAITLNRLQGTPPIAHKDLIRTSRFLNNWAYGTQLGANVLLTLSEAATPMFRQGVIPHVQQGVIPFLRGMMRLGKNGNRRFRNELNDMLIGIETITSIHGQKYELGQDYDLPMNYIEKIPEVAANIMANVTLTNPFTDVFKSVAGIASESNMIRRLKKFSEGKLKGNDLRQLQILRLNSKEKADRILKEFYGTPEKKGFGERLNGANLANLHMWEDKEAANWMRMAVNHEVNSSNFSGKNISSYPDVLDFNGVSSSVFIYMGYMFNATANFALPLLQGIDKTKILGSMAIISASMLVDPLRQIAAGKEPDLEDPTAIAMSGLLNSGIGGFFVDFFNRANAAFDLVPSLQVDRFKDKSGIELFSGAPGAVFNFIGTAASLGINGNNKQDLKTLKRNFPLAEALFLRKITNDYIDSLNIPKTRKKAMKQNRD